MEPRACTSFETRWRTRAGVARRIRDYLHLFDFVSRLGLFIEIREDIVNFDSLPFRSRKISRFNFNNARNTL